MTIIDCTDNKREVIPNNIWSERRIEEGKELAKRFKGATIRSFNVTKTKREFTPLLLTEIVIDLPDKSTYLLSFPEEID